VTALLSPAVAVAAVTASAEIQEEQLDELTDEQLKQMLDDTLLVIQELSLLSACCVQYACHCYTVTDA